MTGKELKQRRKQLGLTQSELAEKLGKDLTTIQRWESTKDDLDVMVELSLDALDSRNSSKANVLEAKKLITQALEKLKKGG